MGASVRVEAGAWLDPRFIPLGRALSGVRKASRQTYRRIGLAAMIEVWSYCTDRGVVGLPAAVIDDILDHDGASQILISAGLASQTDVDSVHVNLAGGVKLLWLAAQRSGAKKGGNSRSRSANRAKDGSYTPASPTDRPGGDLDGAHPAPPTDRPGGDLDGAHPGHSSVTATAPVSSQSLSLLPTAVDALSLPLSATVDVDRDLSPRERAGPKSELPEQACWLAEDLARMILDRLPDFRHLRPDRRAKTLASWAKIFDLCHRRDSREWRMMAELLRWSQADDFWAGNILSAQKFRSQFDQLAAQRKSRDQIAEAKTQRDKPIAWPGGATCGPRGERYPGQPPSSHSTYVLRHYGRTDAEIREIQSEQDYQGGDKLPP